MGFSFLFVKRRKENQNELDKSIKNGAEICVKT